MPAAAQVAANASAAGRAGDVRRRAEEKVPAPRVTDVARRDDFDRDVDDRGHGLEAARRAHHGRVLDAVLQADDQRAVRQVRRDQLRDARGVDGLDADEHDARLAHGGEVDGRAHGDRLVPGDALEPQAPALDRVDVRGPPDQRHGMAGTREHAAEVAADRARPDDRDHGVRRWARNHS